MINSAVYILWITNEITQNKKTTQTSDLAYVLSDTTSSLRRGATRFLYKIYVSAILIVLQTIINTKEYLTERSCSPPSYILIFVTCAVDHVYYSITITGIFH